MIQVAWFASSVDGSAYGKPDETHTVKELIPTSCPLTSSLFSQAHMLLHK